MAVRYDGRVAIVTGSGAGLGRQYAEFLASRGAKVLVNDLVAEKAAEVCRAVEAAGGEAAPNTCSVTDGAKIVAAAVERWGRVDIVINNAGFLRDVAFHKMSPEQFEAVLKVHLFGTYAVTRAAWPHMREAGYGRVVLITSINGLYGTFGQANYSAAKSAMIGLAKTLAKEGQSKGIKVNALAPGGGTQMTATIMPPELVAKWKPVRRVSGAAARASGAWRLRAASRACPRRRHEGPRAWRARLGVRACGRVCTRVRVWEKVVPQSARPNPLQEYVVPCIAYLCAEELEASGCVFEAGGGWMAQVRVGASGPKLRRTTSSGGGSWMRERRRSRSRSVIAAGAAAGGGEAAAGAARAARAARAAAAQAAAARAAAAQTAAARAAAG